jgi:hypothetical protein
VYALVGGVTVAVLALVALHSAPARKLLLSRIIASLNESIEGRLDAAELELHGTTFSVHGLVLRAPRGQVVATAGRIEGVPLWPLVKSRLVLDRAHLADLRVSATTGPDGTDLFDALKRVERDGRGGLDLRSASIGSGRVTVTQRHVAGAAERVEAEVTSGWIGRRAAEGPVVIAFAGASLAPIGGGYDAELRLHPRSDGNARDVLIRARGLGVDLSVRGAEGVREVHVRELVATPDAARALFPPWPLRAPASASGKVTAESARVTATVDGAIGDGRFSAQGELDRTSSRRHRATLTFRAVDGAALGALPPSMVSGRAELEGAPGPGEQSAGAVVVHLDEGSTIAHRKVGPATLRVVTDRGLVRAEAAAALGAEPLAASGTARVSEQDRKVRLERFEATAGATRWVLARPATIRRSAGGVAVDRLTLRSGRKAITARGSASRERLRASVEVTGLDGASVAAAAAAAGVRAPPVHGTFTARMRARGTTSRPILHLDVRSARLRIGALPPAALHVTGSSRGAATRASVTATGRGFRVRVAGEFPASAADAVQRVRAAPGELSFTASGELEAAATALAGTRWGVDRGRVVVRARAGGTVARAWLEANAGLRGVAHAGAPPFDGDVQAVWRGDEARVTGRLAARTGGVVEVSASASGLASAGERDVVLKGSAVARGFDPAPVAAWIPRIESAGGTIDGRAAVEGRADALRTSWHLSWTDGRLVTRGFGTFGPFRAEGRGEGPAGTIAIDGASGRGTFSVRAAARRRGERTEVSGEADLVQLPVVVHSQLRAWATARIAIAGSAGPGGLRATADVEEGDVELTEQAGGSLQAIARPEGIVIHSGGARDGDRDDTARGATAKAALPFDGRLSWQLEVATAQPVAVHGRGIRVRVVTAPALLIEWRDRLLAFGTLRAASGDADVSGKEVDVVSRTELRFAGPPEPPFVEVAAGQDLEPGPMAVQGRRPPHGNDRAPRRQLYSMLSDGRVEAPRSSAHSSVEGAGWGSTIDRALASQLPLGAFLERGTTSRTSDVRSSVTGQVDVGSLSRLAGDTGQGENRRTLRLGVRLTPRLQLEGSSGDGRVTGVDFMWNLRGRD